MNSKHILVTGGAGYCGSVLIPLLLEYGYNVVVFDILYYGHEHLPLEHKNLKIVKGDIRDIAKLKEAMINIHTVIHLVCISNDVSFELDEALSTSINYDAFEPLVKIAKNAELIGLFMLHRVQCMVSVRRKMLQRPSSYSSYIIQ